MSLDVYLYGKAKSVKCECPRCSNEHTTEERECLYSANITHNLGHMAHDAGIYQHLWRPEELGITHAHQLIQPLKGALILLDADRQRFEAHNPSNGWGSYDGLVKFVKDYLDACRDYPGANVEVSR